jgi:glutaredoxin
MLIKLIQASPSRNIKWRGTIAVLAIVINGFFTADLAAQKLYKWVDDEGNVSYHDKPAAAKNTDSHEFQPTIKSSASSSSDRENLRPVIVYTSRDCEPCVQVLEYFESIGVSAQERSISDREVQQRIFEIAGSLSVPSVFIGDTLLTTIDRDSLRSSVLDAGYEITPATEDEEERNAETTPSSSQTSQ